MFSSLAACLLMLTLVFAWAQLHALTHGVSHLGRGHAAPHATLCADCIASANAGAAPPAVIAVAVLSVVAVAFVAAAAVGVTRSLPLVAYRSRAPPRL
ncbi:MAG: hypothetical protein WCH32_05040 [Pseudomonadota bacterium]